MFILECHYVAGVNHALLVHNHFPYVWCPFGFIMRGLIAVLGKPGPERVSSLRVIVYKIQTLAGHHTSPILLKFGMQSCFRVLTTKMNVIKFQFFLLWKISRRSIWGDWRTEGVLVTSILILPS